MSGPFTHTKLNRRRLLILAGTASLGVLTYSFLKERYKSIRKFKILKDENSARGHLVREEFDANQIHSSTEVETLIVGGGISGLTTAYFLDQSKKSNYKILEADQRPGGNSASGGNEVSQFPLGAHYLPIIRNDDAALMSFLVDIGVVTGFKNDLPIYNEEFLCQVPSERLFIKGRWQEGLVPQYAGSVTELAMITEFLALTKKLRGQKGRDGRYLFTIPLDKSSQDVEWIELDRISFRDYLDRKELRGEYLNWYINYCCRDDFGIDAGQTSAWAGLHYFCSRNGKAANAESQAVLTWPQGNGFLVQQLVAKLSQKIQTEATVRKVVKKDHGYEVYYSDGELNTHLINCKNLVYAIPKAVVSRIQPELKFNHKAESYPWIVANIKLMRAALEEKTALNWDNVRFGSEALGYVNSCHQLLQQNAEEINITFYYSFSAKTPTELRKELSQRNENELFDLILQELVKMHPHIESSISAVSLKIHGHGMVAPKPGYIWDKRIQNRDQEPAGLIFAHTERAGISIFEEAFHQGLLAAQKLLNGKTV